MTTPSGMTLPNTGRSLVSPLRNITSAPGLILPDTPTRSWLPGLWSTITPESQRHCPAMANAAATLAELQRRGWQQAVLSASRRDYLIEQVRARGLEDYFTELLGLQDIYGVSKVQVGKDWLRNSGVDPAACVMVGDTTHDAEVAAAMGTKCVLCTSGHQSRARLEAVCAHVIDDISQLPGVLETL